MNNYVQHGSTLTHVVAGAPVVSGQALLVGSLFGICSTAQAVGEEVELALVGVYTLPKTVTDTPSAFALAYWDDTAKEVTTTSTDNTLIGVFAKAAGNGDTVAQVRLNGNSV